MGPINWTQSDPTHYVNDPTQLNPIQPVDGPNLWPSLSGLASCNVPLDTREVTSVSVQLVAIKRRCKSQLN